MEFVAVPYNILQKELILNTSYNWTFKNNLFLLYVCVTACMYVHHMSAGVHGGQKRVPDPRELKLKMIVGYLIWVLGAEL